ncbi:MAG TPA: MFS transporter [Actinomycetes bacterium]|nr:MFS transporter [Actinomycetes bacterium]
MKAGWALLRRRDFGLLWSGGLISETGDWFLLVGLPVWVLQVTGSSLVTATVFLVGLLPGLVVGPLAGVLVDRWDRRRTLVAVSLAQAAFLLPLLAVDGRDRLWIVYLVMAVEAALAQLNDPARNALVPSLVAKADLVGANALIGLNSNLARLVGSPVGGILVEVAGLPGLVVGDAASFLLGAALIALVRSDAEPGRQADRAPDPAHSPAPHPRRAGVVREWVDGLRVTLGDRGLRWGLVVNGLAGVAQGIFTVLFVLFVTRVLGGDGADVGLLRGVQAIGGLLGGVLVVGLATRLEAGRLLGVSLLVFAAVDLAIWNGPVLTTADWLYLGLFVAAGIPGVGVLTGLTSLVQERTAEAYLGRVFATYLGSFNGLMALGMLLAGLLGDTLGVVAVLNAQAGLGLLAGLIAVATLGRRVPQDRYPRASKRVRMPLA